MRKMLFVILLIGVLLISGCGSDNASVDVGDTIIVFGDPGWDSIRLHNAIAGLVAVKVFGYKGYEVITGSSSIVHQGLENGEIDIIMENWVDNAEYYTKGRANGTFVELGTNFDDNVQGFYVPRYVIEGDLERGIEASAPDLKSVADLKRYAHVFPDDEKRGRGRIYGAIPGWMIDDIMYKKYVYNGLDADYEYFRPGSDVALTAVLVSKYEKGEPVVGYYWDPTWLLGKCDFVLLEDEPYIDDNSYKEGKTECPSVKVMIAISNDFSKENDGFIDFLKRYKTTSTEISEALAYMQESGDDHIGAAKWFLSKYDASVEEWLNESQVKVLKDALE